MSFIWCTGLNAFSSTINGELVARLGLTRPNDDVRNGALASSSSLVPVRRWILEVLRLQDFICPALLSRRLDVCRVTVVTDRESTRRVTS